MTEPTGEASSVRYYCTAGNGMETFLVREVKAKLAAEDVCQIPGKVLFSSSVGMDKVKMLKSAERLFLLVRQGSPVTLPAHISSAKAASVLQSRLLGDLSEWSSAVMTWTRLQRELTSRGPSVKDGTASGDEQNGKQTLERKMKEVNEENRVKRKEEEKRGACSRDGQKGTRTSEGKRKRDDDDDEDERGEVLELSVDRQNRTDVIVSEPDVGGRELVIKDCVTSVGDRNTRTACDRMDKVARDRLAVERVKNEKPSEDPEEAESPAPVSFRISCKCTGALSRRFNSQELGRMIGAGLSRGLGWKVDLKNPQLEVNVYLSDDHCVLGIPLTRLPLANRSYIKTTGLRSTVAWAMGSLAEIKAGSLVVDPMCGVGIILLEAAQEHKEAFFLGMDIDDGQLQRANKNVAFADLRDRNELLKASSLELPLSSGSVDAVVCDLPFGRKFGTKTDMATNLPLIVAEMERVLCIGGVLVLLLSPQLSRLLKKFQTHQGSGPSSTQETQLQTGLPDSPSSPLSSTNHETHHNQLGVGPPLTQGTEPQTGLQDDPSSPLFSTIHETHHTHLGIGPPLTQGTEPQIGVQDGQSPPLSSLKLQATHRVSLGAIDGLIHKYIKIKT